MTLPSAVSKTRPRYEPVSAAMQYRGLWRLVTDGDESLAELLVDGDAPPAKLEQGITQAIKQGWPLLLVLPQVIPDGYRCNPD